MLHEVYLLLGANLGARLLQLASAREQITSQIGAITGSSAVYETSSWGAEEPQPNYVNQVVLVQTALDPITLLEKIHAIEQHLGRVRTFKWDSRVIDIDILFYGSQLVDLPNLQIPHPHFQERNFALAPMYELSPDFNHPVLKKSVKELYQQSPDALCVWLYKEADFSCLEDYIGQDPAMQQSIIRLFLEQTPEEINLLSKHIQSEDFMMATSQAHRIKPTLNYMGAISLRDELQELESLLKGQLDVDNQGAPEPGQLSTSFRNIQLRFEVLMTELQTYLDTLK